MKKTAIKYILIVFFLLFSLLLVIIFAGSSFLTGYIKAGLGDCNTAPVICTSLDSETIKGPIDTKYIQELTMFTLPEIKISLPHQFAVSKQEIHLRRFYYNEKQIKEDQKEPIVYLLYEPPNYFVNLFPEAKKAKIKDDYAFFLRLRRSVLNNIENLNDAFFHSDKVNFYSEYGGSDKFKDSAV